MCEKICEDVVLDAYKLMVKHSTNDVYRSIQSYVNFVEMLELYDCIAEEFKLQTEIDAQAGCHGYAKLAWGEFLRTTLWEGAADKKHGWVAAIYFSEMGPELALAMVSRTVAGMKRILRPVKMLLNRVVNTCGVVYAHADICDQRAVTFIQRLGFERVAEIDRHTSDTTYLGFALKREEM